MALGFLGDMLGLNAGKATRSAARENSTKIGNWEDRAVNTLDTATSEARGLLNNASGLYGDILARGGAGAGLYDDAMGLNGAEGAARAQDAFTTGPSYQFGLDQGLQALDRRASAGGSYHSGGADLDTLKYATGYAGQAYDGWLDRLGGYNDLQLAGTAGQAGALGDLASLVTGSAGQKIDIGTQALNGQLGASNQFAAGKEASTQGLANLGGAIAGIGGKLIGAKTGWF